MDENFLTKMFLSRLKRLALFIALRVSGISGLILYSCVSNEKRAYSYFSLTPSRLPKRFSFTPSPAQSLDYDSQPVNQNYIPHVYT